MEQPDLGLSNMVILNAVAASLCSYVSPDDFSPQTLEAVVGKLGVTLPRIRLVNHADLKDVVYSENLSTLPKQVKQHFIVAKDSEDNLYIAFRGTASWEDVITDLKAWQRLSAGNDVHGGVLERARTVPAEAIVSSLRETISLERHAKSLVIFVGHSLGGAIATAVACDMLTENIYSLKWRANVRCITFGAPLTIGNASPIRTKEINGINASRYFLNIITTKDIVPRCVPLANEALQAIWQNVSLTGILQNIFKVIGALGTSVLPFLNGISATPDMALNNDDYGSLGASLHELSGLKTVAAFGRYFELVTTGAQSVLKSCDENLTELLAAPRITTLTSRCLIEHSVVVYFRNMQDVALSATSVDAGVHSPPSIGDPTNTWGVPHIKSCTITLEGDLLVKMLVDGWSSKPCGVEVSQISGSIQLLSSPFIPIDGTSIPPYIIMAKFDDISKLAADNTVRVRLRSLLGNSPYFPAILTRLRMMLDQKHLEQANPSDVVRLLYVYDVAMNNKNEKQCKQILESLLECVSPRLVLANIVDKRLETLYKSAWSDMNTRREPISPENARKNLTDLIRAAINNVDNIHACLVHPLREIFDIVCSPDKIDKNHTSFEEWITKDAPKEKLSWLVDAFEQRMNIDSAIDKLSVAPLLIVACQCATTFSTYVFRPMWKNILIGVAQQPLSAFANVVTWPTQRLEECLSEYLNMPLSRYIKIYTKLDHWLESVKYEDYEGFIKEYCVTLGIAADVSVSKMENSILDMLTTPPKSAWLMNSFRSISLSRFSESSGFALVKNMRSAKEYLMKNRSIAVVGSSRTGKSSLINYLWPQFATPCGRSNSTTQVHRYKIDSKEGNTGIGVMDFPGHEDCNVSVRSLVDSAHGLFASALIIINWKLNDTKSLDEAIITLRRLTMDGVLKPHWKLFLSHADTLTNEIVSESKRKDLNSNISPSAAFKKRQKTSSLSLSAAVKKSDTDVGYLMDAMKSLHTKICGDIFRKCEQHIQLSEIRENVHFCCFFDSSGTFEAFDSIPDELKSKRATNSTVVAAPDGTAAFSVWHSEDVRHWLRGVVIPDIVGAIKSQSPEFAWLTVDSVLSNL